MITQSNMVMVPFCAKKTAARKEHHIKIQAGVLLVQESCCQGILLHPTSTLDYDAMVSIIQNFIKRQEQAK